MDRFQSNPKATALLNISIGLFVAANIINSMFKVTPGTITYFALVFAILLISLGAYNFFINFKKQPIFYDKAFGYLCIIVSILFLISTTVNFYTTQLHLISAFLGTSASVIALRLGILLIKNNQ